MWELRHKGSLCHMLKIAVITRYWPSSGEPWQGRSAFQTLRSLDGLAKVRVFYPNAAYPAVLKPRSRLYRRLDPTYAPAEVETSYHNYPALPLLTRPFNGALAARALLPHVRSFAPDLIFSIFLYPEGFAALRIARSLGVPAVSMGIGSDIHSIADRISVRHTRQVLRGSDFLVTVSEDLRRQAIAMGADPLRSRALLNGCDLSVFRPGDRAQARQALGIPLNGPAIVYVGRTDVRKGFRELIAAAAKLHESQPDLQVYLVGAGPDRPEIAAAINTAEAQDYIRLMPPCRPEDVPVWMTAADVVTLPSYMEGCPNVVLEALACGRPVVATRVGGIPELMDDSCGRLVPPRDAGALAEALDTVLSRSWDAVAIASHRSRSWNTVAGELLEIFERVSAPRNGTR